VPVEPDPELMAGRYELGPVIGQGGMGTVRRARDLRLGRDVAIKFLRPDLAADPDVRRRFEEEARAAARLGHAHAVTVFDTSEQDGEPYIVMEYLPGITLADELARGQIPTDRVRKLALAVLGALAAAHEVGIIHRDIKPANILITGDGTAKVVDFGIAKSTEGLDHTLAGQIIGTPAYLAPERLEGKRATPQSDLYSLAVVLYEALTGRKPFVGDTPLALAHAVHSTEPVPLLQLRPEVDADLAATVERAMDKEPERRFSSAEEMRRSLMPTTPQVEVPRVAVAPSDRGGLTRRVPVDPTRRGTAPAALSPSPAPPEQPPRHRPGLNGARVLALVAAAAIVLVAVVTFAGRDREAPLDQPATTTGISVPPPNGSLPPALDDAIRRLEEAVGR
jgi:serine/threonine-protein kinase